VEPEATPIEGIPEATATVEAAPTVTPGVGEEEPPSPGGRSLAVLIDSLVVALASLWLCCGGLVLIVFVLLVIASFVLRVT